MRKNCLLMCLLYCVVMDILSQPNHSGLVEIDIPKLIQQDIEPTSLSILAKSCSYIPLEFTEKSSIADIIQVYSTDHKIIVVCRDACFIFEKPSGKFVYKIDYTGVGIRSSAIDEKNGIVYLISSRSSITGYSTENDGHMAHYIPPSDPEGRERVWQIGVIDSLTYAGIVRNVLGNEKNRFLIGSFNKDRFSSRFRIFNRYVYYIPNHYFYKTVWKDAINNETGEIYGFGLNTHWRTAPDLLYNFNGQLFVKEAWNDTVFQIQKPNKILPKYVFSLDALKMPAIVYADNFKEWQLKVTEYIAQVFPVETNGYLFFSFLYKGIRYTCMYDKNKHRSALVDKRENDCLYGMQNDLLGNIPFWPQYINSKNKEMLTWINADVFHQYQKNQGIDILPNLQKIDNPVIMLISF